MMRSPLRSYLCRHTGLHALLGMVAVQAVLLGFLFFVHQDTLPASLFWQLGAAGLGATLVVLALILAFSGRRYLSRMAALREALAAAGRDIDNTDRYALSDTSDDELGEIVEASNRLLAQVAGSHRDSLYFMTALSAKSTAAHLGYDVGGKLVYANTACVRLCGFSRLGELEMSGLPKFELEPGGDALSLPQTLLTGSYSREATLIGRDGARATVLVDASRVPQNTQTSVRFYASITDVSAYRSATQELEEQNLKLETANRAKSEFLANMSHELRTPLNAIIGFSETLVGQMFGPLGNERYEEYVRDINESGKHLLGIINDILDLSKIEAGRMELSEEEIDLGRLMDSVVRIVQERAREAELELKVQVPPDIPGLYADERAVKQMLINLLSNSIKFTDAGGTVTVGAQCRKGAIMIGVADTGVGMTREEAEMALEPFRQVDGSHTRKHEGTGLGLPLVKSLAELHGGRFRLDSGPDRGTTVTLSFPAARTVKRSDAPSAASVA